MDDAILKCQIVFSAIPENKLKRFTRKNGEEETAIDFTVVKRQTPDNFGNTHSIYISQTKAEWEEREPKIFIGSAKIYGKQTNNNNNLNNAPF